MRRKCEIQEDVPGSVSITALSTWSLNGRGGVVSQSTDKGHIEIDARVLGYIARDTSQQKSKEL